ncbi:hypothetical protein MADP07_00013 [Mycoplasma anatis]|uniref:Uncharacterized protein n=1 Tax=Mycoplasmopsis anatis TaxID=171279 RepID=A0A9Q3L868_9BACT|nr:hypothetical protein [Mycoplasmopsis anatis]MBW0596618.1 hypothetical protein [Mycoplasmopsis anatis]MBW0602306.1 hypothetical protein [Mycoplasmopsis anatis]MBW0603821.1 hypothetical protein [Mycoplasmopsis anatis]
MKNKKKIILGTTTASAFIVGVGTLGLNIGLHTKVKLDSSVKTTIRNLKSIIDDAPKSFKFLKNDNLNNLINNSMEILNSNKSLNDKINNVNSTRESLLNNLIDNFPNSISPNESNFLEELLKNQANFINESDLRNQFLTNNQELIKEIVESASNPENTEKTKELLNQYKENLDNQLKKQEQLFQPYIDYINEIIGEGENRLPESEIEKLYKDYENLILSNDININSLETLKKQIEQKRSEEDSKNELEKQKEKIKELIQSNKDLINNPNPQLAKDIESKLSSINSPEELDLYEKLLNDNLVRYSDLSKPLDELKNSFKELIANNPLTTFKDKFNEFNNISPELIDSITDVAELARIKNEYLNDLEHFKYAENKHNEIQKYLENSHVNVDITKKDFDDLTKEANIENLFNGVKNKDDLKKKVDALSKNYNQIKDKNVVANSQLDQLLEDLKFFDQYPDTKNTVKGSNDVIKQKIQNAQNSDSLDSLDLDVYTRVLQEDLRQNAKEQLKYLEDKAAQVAKRLQGLNDPLSKSILDKINQLNDESSKLSDRYSPSSTSDLKDQILKYDFLKNVNQLFDLNNEIITKNNSLSNLLDSLFPEDQKDNPMYKNTQNELNKVNDLVNNIKNDLSVLDNPDKFAELLDSLKKAQEAQDLLENNLNEKNELDNLLRQYEQGKDYINSNPELKDKISTSQGELDNKMNELKEKLNNPSLSDSERKDIVSQIKESLQKQQEDINLGLSEIELEKTLNEINKYYPDDGNRANDSRGEGGLRKQFEQIKEKILDPNLSQSARNDLISKLAELRDTAPKIKDLEEAKEKLENSIDNAISSEHDRITESKLQSAKSGLKHIDSVIERMLSDQLPSLNEIDEATNIAEKQSELLDLAVQQDKIIIANNKLQEKNKNIDDPDYLAIKNAFDRMNAFTNSESTNNDLGQINATADKIQSMIPLADELNNLYDFISSVKNEPEYDGLEKQAKELLRRSLFNQDHTPSQIQDSVNEIKEALKVYEAKKKLNDEIKKLDNIFNDSDENNKESDRAIYSDIKKKIEALKSQNNALFNSPYETENSINQAIDELIKQREKLLEEKQVAKENYDLEVEKTQNKLNDYKNNIIPQDKQGHPNYTYDKSGETENKFNDRKDKPDATIEEIKQINQELDKAFKHDQANNAIKDLEEFVKNAANLNSFANDPELGKVKQSLDNLIGDLKNKIADPNNFDIATLEKIKEQANAALNLAKEQESPVLQKIKEFQSDPLKKEDHDALVAAVLKSVPNVPYEPISIKNQHSQLIKDSNNILQLSDIRDSNAKTLGSKQEPLTGLYKQAKDLLGNPDISDQKAYEEFVKELDKLAELNKKATDKSVVEEVKAKLAELEQRLVPLQKLASAVKQEEKAKQAINSNSNHNVTQDFLNRFIPTIDKNISDSQSIYMKPRVDNDTLNAKADALNGPAGYSHVKEVTQAIDLAQKVTTLMNRIQNDMTLNPEIEYHEYEQVNGNPQNYNNWSRWFKDLLTSFYNNRTQENYDELSLVLGRATLLFDKQKEVSQKITSRKTEVTSYNGYQTDVDYLVKKLWDSTPITYSEQNSPEAWKTDLSNRVSKLDEILQIEEKNHTKRTEIKNKIQDYKTNKIQQLNSDSDKLKSALNERISRIENKNIASLDGDSLRAGLQTETFSDIEKELQVLVDIFDKSREISSRVKVARDIIINFSSTDNLKLRDQLEQLKAKCDLIDSKYGQYNSVDVQDGKIDIITDLNELNKILVKVEFVSERSKVEALLNSNLELSSEEKNVIFDLLNTAQKEFEHNLSISPVSEYNNVINDIKLKYFEAAKASPAAEVVVSEPTKIYQIFENSVLVKKEIISARNIISYETLLSSDPDMLIDSKNTHDIYRELNEAINQATSAISNGFIDESNKQTSLNKIREKLNALNESKKQDAQRIIDRANELKSYMTSADKYGKTYEVRVEFTSEAIDKVQEAKKQFEAGTININQLNEVLKNADNEIKNQVLGLFNLVKAQVLEELSNVMELREKFQSENTRSGADVAQSYFDAIVNAINNSRNVETTDTKNYRDAVNYKEILEREYKDKYGKLTQSRNNFISVLKEGFNKYLNTSVNTSTSKKGLFVLFDESMNPYINNTDKTNLLENVKFNQTIQLYKNTFATNLTDLTNDISSITAENITDATRLSEYGTKLTSFRNDFNNLIKTIHTDGTNFTSPSYRGNLNEIINEISTSNTDSSFDGVKNDYQVKVDEFNTLLASIKSSIDANSDDIKSYTTRFIEVFTKVGGLYTWVNETVNEEKFFNYITYNSRFDTIEVKDESRRVDFINALLSFVPTDNSQTIEFIDITNSKTLLSYFNKFAFTELDLESIINRDNVKVRIVKQPDHSWYQKVVNNDPNKQILALKLEYYYRPNNLRNFANKDEIKITKDIRIDFKTNNIAQIKPGTSSIFVQRKNNSNSFGSDAKVEFLDLERSGLLDNNETNEQIIDRIYNSFKTNVLKGQDKVVIAPNDSSNDYKFKISLPTFNTVDQFISIKGSLNDSYQIVFGDDDTKTINVINIMPSTIISAKRTNKDGEGGRWYLEQYGKVLDAEPWSSVEKETMPFAVVNLFKFKFTIETVNNEKKAMTHLDYFEGSLFAKHFKLQDNQYTNTSTVNGRVVWSANDFANYLSKNMDLIYNSSNKRLESAYDYDSNQRINWTTNNKFTNKVALLSIDRSVDSPSNGKQFNFRSGFLYLRNGSKNWANRMQQSVIFNSGIIELFFKLRSK